MIGKIGYTTGILPASLRAAGLTLYFLFLMVPFGAGEPAFASQAGEKPPENRGVSMRVLWRISEYKIGKDAVMGKSEARRMLFEPLEISKGKITFNGRTCRDVTFKKERVDAKEYLKRVYGIRPKTLGIGEVTIEVVRTNCDFPGFAEYMRLRDSRLVVWIKGVFFFFEPAVNR